MLNQQLNCEHYAAVKNLLLIKAVSSLPSLSAVVLPAFRIIMKLIFTSGQLG